LWPRLFALNSADASDVHFDSNSVCPSHLVFLSIHTDCYNLGIVGNSDSSNLNKGNFGQYRSPLNLGGDYSEEAKNVPFYCMSLIGKKTVQDIDNILRECN
jgi:hypothetical protein